MHLRYSQFSRENRKIHKTYEKVWILIYEGQDLDIY